MSETTRQEELSEKKAAGEKALRQAGERRRRPAGPCLMVIFGASGDLTKRKLIPALYNLAATGLLAERFAVIGCSSSQWTTEEFRDTLTHEIGDFAGQHVEPELWDSLVARMHYVQGDFRKAGTYEKLAQEIGKLDQEIGTAGNYLFYLATPPDFFLEIVQHLGAVGLVAEQEGHWRRVVIEKPFGHDLDSAVALNRELAKVLEERQIYRIDHYLGKETVQNILVFRFANGIFEPIWNRRYVDHVQITVAESLGVEDRGRYYEKAGALRDMIPNHLFQLMAFTAMEPPTSFHAEAVRDEKAKILSAVQPMTPEEVLRRTVRGQYGEGTSASGESLPAYRVEPRVEPQSATETYVALKLLIDNWRWADVPFYLRTGKRLAQRVTEVAIQFKRAPFMLFRDTSVERLSPNLLVIKIAPDEGISLRFGAKVPGPSLALGGVDMEFHYADYFGSDPSTGYETLLYDCMNGDATLFQRADNVEAGWKVVAPILDVWKALPPRDFPNYAAGSWGPEAADHLLERESRKWRAFDDED